MSKKSDLNDADLRIIDEIQRNRSVRLREVDERVTPSRATIARRIRQFEERKIFRHHSSVVDPRKIGIEITSYIMVILMNKGLDAVKEFEQHINEMEEVIECHAVTGNADYLLRVVARDWTSYSLFLRERMTMISNINFVSLIEVEEVKYRTALPIGYLFFGSSHENGHAPSDEGVPESLPKGVS